MHLPTRHSIKKVFLVSGCIIFLIWIIGGWSSPVHADTPITLLGGELPYIGSTYTQTPTSFNDFLRNIAYLFIGLIFAGTVVVLTINAVKGGWKAYLGVNMSLKEWGGDAIYAIPMVLLLFVGLQAIDPRLTSFALLDTIRSTVDHAKQIVLESAANDVPETPDTTIDTTPPDGLFDYQTSISNQIRDESPQLRSLMQCMQAKVPGDVGSVSGISDSLIASGVYSFEYCAQHGQPDCHHDRNSGHYGGTQCVGKSYAVDFGDERNLSYIQKAAQECNSGAIVQIHDNVQISTGRVLGRHIHVDIARASGCK